MECAICGCKIEGFGNNPDPLIKDKDARCCDICNNYVIQYRILLLSKELTDKEKEQARINILKQLRK